jgi:hypothetical protein
MSDIFKYNGKLLIVDGKLAANENCCCGFCCVCIGPFYGYGIVFPPGFDTLSYGAFKPFGGIVPLQGWDGEVTFTNEEGLFIVIERRDGALVTEPEEGFTAVSAAYGTGGLCHYIEQLQNGVTIEGKTYIINGDDDNLYFGSSEWTITDSKKYSECFNECSDKKCCEQCRDIDTSSLQSFIETSNDPCGSFCSSSNKICCEERQLYDENNLCACLCDKSSD